MLPKTLTFQDLKPHPAFDTDRSFKAMIAGINPQKSLLTYFMMLSVFVTLAPDESPRVKRTSDQMMDFVRLMEQKDILVRAQFEVLSEDQLRFFYSELLLFTKMLSTKMDSFRKDLVYDESNPQAFVNECYQWVLSRDALYCLEIVLRDPQTKAMIAKLDRSAKRGSKQIFEAFDHFLDIKNEQLYEAIQDHPDEWWIKPIAASIDRYDPTQD